MKLEPQVYEYAPGWIKIERGWMRGPIDKSEYSFASILVALHQIGLAYDNTGGELMSTIDLKSGVRIDIRVPFKQLEQAIAGAAMWEKRHA